MFSELCTLKDIKSRSICPENFTGEKGGGGRAETGTGAGCARELGIGWKVSPSIQIAPGETFVLAEIFGEGKIKHIWIVDDCNLNRQLILRMYLGRQHHAVGGNAPVRLFCQRGLSNLCPAHLCGGLCQSQTGL